MTLISSMLVDSQGLHKTKDLLTGQLAFDCGTEIGTVDARRSEASDACRSDGKHGMPGAGPSDSAVRFGFFPNRLTGTAGCGPACPVVRELGMAR